MKSYSDHSIIAEKKVLLNFVTSIYLPAKRKSFWDDDFINIYSVNRRHPGSVRERIGSFRFVYDVTFG